MFTPLQISQQAGTIRLHLTGYIGEDVTEQQVLQQLEALPDAEQIEVFINSAGGSVPVGNAIAHLLRSHPAPKTAYIVGSCASMATLIALSCQRIVMDGLAEWMVHLPTTTATGRSDQLADAARISEEMERQFVQLYVQRTGMPEANMLALLRAERWLPARRAQELGFVDEVLELQMAAFYPKAPSGSRTTTPASPVKRPSQIIRLAQADEGRSGWQYLYWGRKDPAGLAEMKCHEPQRFEALLARMRVQHT